MSATVERDPRYAFCETIHASSYTPWHIRQLTDAGRKFGGGADTPALCGLRVSWDIPTPVNPILEHACNKCVEAYLLAAREVPKKGNDHGNS